MHLEYVFVLLLVKFNCYLCEETDTNTNDEPRCSKFDYDLEMIRTLVKLEEKLKAFQVDLTTLNAKMEKVSADGHGSVYARWGRNSCHPDAELIYNGYIGGKLWQNQGSGSDSVCLPSDPTWSNYSDGNDPYRGRMYGTEINPVSDDVGIFPYAVEQQDMPCAVCKTFKSITLMIPARESCYAGWKLEYSGYLMTNDHEHVGSHNHICVDSRPEFLPKNYGNDNEHTVMLVESHCGSLPCPPYVQGRELACVVCSI
ncbi:uncharacterized protein LOC123557287 [Mercenaria mercenaria]|uniref:uncharacterized protein LOC123557287 n=1 Tax=Mercenaria mercenaria TaxID=6596 RepID=UPI00234EB916|nr:uncharacterized protein LOC123557287 [Mercenaria mercenaria]